MQYTHISEGSGYKYAIGSNVFSQYCIRNNQKYVKCDMCNATGYIEGDIFGTIFVGLRQGSANFLGSRAGRAPKELAAGRTGKFYVKNLITVDSPSPSSSCHVVSAKALRGNVEIFGILFRIFHDQLHQFSAIYYFSNFTKMSQFY